MKAFEKSCYLLPWPEVSEILTDEVEKHLVRHVPCWAKYEDESFWCTDQPVLPLHEACQIMQLSGFPAEDWQDTLPDEGGNTVNGFGMELSEHLLRKGLGFAWMRQIIAPEGLWLVGVYDKKEHLSEHAGRISSGKISPRPWAVGHLLGRNLCPLCRAGAPGQIGVHGIYAQDHWPGRRLYLPQGQPLYHPAGQADRLSALSLCGRANAGWGLQISAEYGAEPPFQRRTSPSRAVDEEILLPGG